jgi:hypothetical protein
MRIAKEEESAMEYQIFVRPDPGFGFQATPLGLPDCVFKAPSKQEAVAQAQAALASMFAEGEIVSVVVPTPNPWLDAHGRLQAEPLFDEWVSELAEIRRQANADHNLQ